MTRLWRSLHAWWKNISWCISLCYQIYLFWNTTSDRCPLLIKTWPYRLVVIRLRVHHHNAAFYWLFFGPFYFSSRRASSSPRADEYKAPQVSLILGPNCLSTAAFSARWGLRLCEPVWGCLCTFVPGTQTSWEKKTNFHLCSETEGLWMQMSPESDPACREHFHLHCCLIASPQLYIPPLYSVLFLQSARSISAVPAITSSSSLASKTDTSRTSTTWRTDAHNGWMPGLTHGATQTSDRSRNFRELIAAGDPHCGAG